MVRWLSEPFRTMMQIQLCLGLRVSELLALRWKDVDWIGSKLNVEYGIVNQHLDSVKTHGSCRAIRLEPELLQVLQAWKQQTEFAGSEDWIFASPVKLGRLPISYTTYKTALQNAAGAIGITSIGTHSLRHTYCSWLRAERTDAETRQKLMRHSDPRTTQLYGEADTAAMEEAHSRISRRAFDSRVIPESATN
jgi:integrase